MNAYEKLYRNTKSQFTIVSDNKEYTLGELMLEKAGKKEAASISASKKVKNTQSSVSAFINYVNDKISIKNSPAKERIIKRFPLRTSLSAVLSAMIVCTLVLSFGLFSGKALTSNDPAIAENENTSDVSFTEYDK